MKAYINDIEYELDAQSLSLSEKSGNSTASDIAVFVGKNQPIPQSGDIIEIKDSEGDIYFLGVCGIPKSPEYSSPYDVRRYEITCSNANSILARRVANVAYKGYTITQIVTDLYNRYIQAEGFTLGTISDIPIVINVYTAADFNLKDVLDELAEYVQGVWQCTNERTFNFIASADFPRLEKTINSDFIPITNIQLSVKDTDLSTNQIISGATSTTDIQTEQFTYSNDEIESFTLSFPLSQRPAIKINNNPIEPSVIGVSGLDEGNDFMFFFTYNSQILTYNKDYSGTLLSVGDILEVNYTGIYQTRIELRNEDMVAKISEKTNTSGLIDNVRIDKTISNIDDAVNLASSLLGNHGDYRSEITAWTTVKMLNEMGLQYADTQLLKKWTFDLPQYGIIGDYVIIERTTSQLILKPGIENMQVTLKFVDRGFLKSYGEIFNELSKSVAQLNFREDETVVDVTAINEPVDLSEMEARAEHVGFTPIWCTSETMFDFNGQRVSPTELSLYMFSTETGGQ